VDLTTVPVLTIMICSTRADLQEYRDEAKKIIERLGEEKKNCIQIIPKRMEDETQSGRPEWSADVSREWVEKANWIVLILGFEYGGIGDSPDAEGLSYTELEYKHALSHGKDVFVFVAGGPEDREDDQYRVSPGEKYDLKNSLWRRTPQADRFRREVRTHRRVQIFAGLSTFRDQLDKTLREHVDKLVRKRDAEEIGALPSAGLAHLVTLVDDAFTDFTDKIELIAECKAVHDAVHGLLQNVVPSLQDELASMWNNDARLMRRLGFLREEEGKLRAVKLGEEGRSSLRTTVHAVIEAAEKFHPIETSVVESSSFQALAEALSDAVNHAFKEADRRMQLEEKELVSRRETLRNKINAARTQLPLTEAEVEQLDQWINTMADAVTALLAALDKHTAWQQVYEQIEEFEKQRVSQRFEQKLPGFRDYTLATLRDLVNQELDAGRKGRLVTVEETGCQDPMTTLTKLADRLDRLDERLTGERFDEIRQPFDSAFFCLDKRTLAEVNDAKRLVKHLRAVRDKLLCARGMDVQHAG
jgi:hypothetical protein